LHTNWERSKTVEVSASLFDVDIGQNGANVDQKLLA
jgi:hypothetical protein